MAGPDEAGQTSLDISGTSTELASPPRPSDGGTGADAGAMAVVSDQNSDAVAVPPAPTRSVATATFNTGGASSSVASVPTSPRRPASARGREPPSHHDQESREPPKQPRVEAKHSTGDGVSVSSRASLFGQPRRSSRPPLSTASTPPSRPPLPTTPSPGRALAATAPPAAPGHASSANALDLGTATIGSLSYAPRGTASRVFIAPERASPGQE